MIFFVTFVVGSVVIYMVAPVAGPWMMACFRKGGPPPEDAGDGIETKVAPIESFVPPAPPADVPQKPPEDEDTPPALAGVFPTKSNEQPGWGVTSRRVSYYTLNGTYVGTLDGGILFDCEGTITSEGKGTMVKCRFLHAGMPDDLFLIGRKNAQFFTSTHRKLLKAKIQALKDYYALSANIEARKAELLESGAQRNPYFAEARAAYEAFQKSVQNAKQLEQMRDKLTDAKRMELEDQLRELKLKEVEVKKTMDEANEKFAAWKKAHAAELPQPEDDANIQEWTREKRRLAAALPGLAF